MNGTAEPGFAAAAREVTGAWPQVVQVWERFRDHNGLRLRADVGDTDRQGFLTEALGAAYARQRLDHLTLLLEERDLVSPAFAQAIAPYCTATFTMQSVVNNVWRTQYVATGVRGLIRARENVCRISVDGRHRGTGVLIRPNLVVTAGHVVAPLVDATGKAVADGLGRLALHFSPGQTDEDPASPPPPIVARLHQDWLAHYSAPAPKENQGLSIDSVAGIADTGPWDLAVIRLHVPPADGMSGYVLLANYADPPSFGVHVLHHPADEVGDASPMLWSVGQVRQALGDTRPLRLLHDANTSGGSSGAPCFDNNWKLVALHQAGPHKIREPNQRNRAVPIHAWMGSIDGWAAAAASVPYLTAIDDSGGRRVPVIGRRDLQAALWRAMSRSAGDPVGSERVFVVRGEAGLGKAFTLPIVQALARLAGHPVATLDLRNAQGDDAVAFAARVAGAMASGLPTGRVAPSGLTSGLRDLRNDVAPALLAELGAAAAGRQAWLVLHGWDEAAFPPSSPARQLTELVIAGMDQVPGLHLVLTGWTGGGASFVETLGPPEARDIVDYLLTTQLPGGEPAPEDVTRLLVSAIAGLLAQEPPGEPYARAIAVAERARATVELLVPRRAGGGT